MSNHDPATPASGSRIVDPFEVLHDVEDIFRRVTGDETFKVVTPAVGNAVAMMAGLIAACGLIPAVDGDTMHPRCMDGLAALETVRERGHYRQDRRRR